MKLVALTLIATVALAVSVLALFARRSRIRAAQRMSASDAGPIFPTAPDDAFHQMQGSFHVSNELTPTVPAGSQWRGIALHGPRAATVTTPRPGDTRCVVLAGWLELPAPVAQRAAREMIIAYTNVATHERQQAPYGLVASAGAPSMPSPIERQQPQTPDQRPSAVGAIGMPFFVNLWRLDLAAGTYVFVAQLGDVTSNEARVVIARE